MPEVCAALQPVLTIWPILYPWPPRPAAWIYLCLCWGRFWFSWYSFISTLSFISWMVGFSCLILRAAAESDRISYCSFTTCQSVNSLSCSSSIILLFYNLPKCQFFVVQLLHPSHFPKIPFQHIRGCLWAKSEEGEREGLLWAERARLCLCARCLVCCYVLLFVWGRRLFPRFFAPWQHTCG